MPGFFDDDPLFRMFTDRVLTLVSRGAAETGEVAVTAERVTPGDAGSWYDAWTATADRVARAAHDSAAGGHRVSAADGFRRATTYYQAAYQPLYGEPVDPRLTRAFDRESDCFSRFAALAPHPVEAVAVPFESTTLPGYLCLPDGGGEGLPTLVSVNGYDSTLHEVYSAHALPAVRRGHACLLVDGPGQGGSLIRQGLRLRPDWDTVLRPVIDYLEGRPETDPGRVAVMGWSLGGFLAPRGVAGEPRAAALIADPGMWDLITDMPLPEDVKQRLPDADAAELDALLAPLARTRVGHWQLVQRGQWVHGVGSPGEYAIELSRYRLSAVAGRIACPALLVTNDADPNSAHAQELYDAVAGPKTLLRLGSGDGAAGHCQPRNRALFDRHAFDWLAGVLAR